MISSCASTMVHGRIGELREVENNRRRAGDTSTLRCTSLVGLHSSHLADQGASANGSSMVNAIAESNSCMAALLQVCREALAETGFLSSSCRIRLKEASLTPPTPTTLDRHRLLFGCAIWGAEWLSRGLRGGGLCSAGVQAKLCIH